MIAKKPARGLDPRVDTGFRANAKIQIGTNQSFVLSRAAATKLATF